MRFRHAVQSLFVGVVAFLAWSGIGLRAEDLRSQYWAVLTPTQVEALIDTVSGEASRDHIRIINRYWRWAPSRGFHQAAEYVVEQAKSYGLQDAHIERFIADRETRYLGVTLHRPSWDPIAGELWVVEPVRQKVTSFADVPMAIAGYSRTTDVQAEIVDVGAGTTPEDYEGKNVRGKIVLGTGAVGVLQQMAVFERGALGVLSAWSPEIQTSRDPIDYPDFVTWGTGVVPESSDGQPSTFAFMLSRRQHRDLLALLSKHPRVVVHATVEAEFKEPGYLEAVTATIPGREHPDQELIFVAHLEHPKPSANDNLSGSATLLEIARSLQELIRSGQLPAPKRTIRFLWVQEGRSTRTYLAQHPEVIKRALAVINLDMVGEDPVKTRAILYFWRASASRPTFVSDVVQDFFEVVRNTNNERTVTEPLHPIIAPTGNRRPFTGQIQRYRFGSDEVFFIGVGVPGMFFAAWPDEFHHTPFDTPDKADPTQLERVAFIGAAAAAAIAGAGPEDSLSISTNVLGRARVRLGEDLTKALRLLERAPAKKLGEAHKEAVNVIHQGYLREQQNLDTIRVIIDEEANALAYLNEQQHILAGSQPETLQHIQAFYELRARQLGQQPERISPTEEELLADRKVPVWKMSYSADVEAVYARMGHSDFTRLQILKYAWAQSGAFATLFNTTLFETLNFINGRRSIKEIRDAVSAEYEPVPLEVVEELIESLAKHELVEIRTE